MNLEPLNHALVIALLLAPLCGTASDAALEGRALFVSAALSRNAAEASCDIRLGAWDHYVFHPYTIQKGDILEYDAILSPAIPMVAGDLDLTFPGSDRLSDLLSARNPAFGDERSEHIRAAVGKWRHFRVPLDAAAGRNLQSWIYRIEGGKQGVYSLALDNLKITHDGISRVDFFSDEPGMPYWARHTGGFQGGRVMSFKRAFLDRADDLRAAFGKIEATETALRRMHAVKLGAKLLREEFARESPTDKRDALLEKALSRINPRLLNEMRPREFNTQLDDQLALLQPLRPLAKQRVLHAVAYAHLDFLWMWSWAATLVTAKQDFEQVLEFMNEFPEFTFSDTNPALFEAIEREYPPLFAAIQKRAREGRWEMVGSRWCEADSNLISEEANVRHFLYAHRYNREKFGAETPVNFEPDIFGHLCTMPQILAKSGVRFYVSRRMNAPARVFWWQGLDGARVLTCDIHHYMDWLDENVLTFSLSKAERARGETDAMVVYGVGNHGGGPSRDQIQTGISLDQNPVYPAVRFSTIKAFMKKIASQPQAARAPVATNDLCHPFSGAYTVNADTKRLNRACENTLATAESFACVAQLLGIGPPANRFDSVWRSLLWAHHHDTIGGTTIHPSALYARKILRELHQDVSGDLRQTLADIAAQITTQGGTEHPRVIFSPLAWPTSGPVEIPLPSADTRWEWNDGSGKTQPIQIRTPPPKSAPITGTVVLQDLPALGYRTGWLRAQVSGGETPLRKTGAFAARNQHIEIAVSPQSGNLIHLTHLPSGRSWISTGTESAIFRIDHEAPHNLSAWQIGPIVRTERLNKADRVEWIEEGPVRMVIRAQYRFGQSRLEKDVILYRDLSRVDFEVRADWQEKGGADRPAPMLRLEFPCAVKKPKAMWLVPFGEVERPQDGVDYAASYGMGFDDGGGSVCLLNNYKCGYSATNQTLRLTLLRSPYDPDPAPDIGQHTIALALEVSPVPWSQSAFTRRGMEFNRPPVAVAVPARAAKLPSEQSFLEVVSPSSVALTTLKPCYDTPNNVVVRLVNCANSPAQTQVRFTLPVGKWLETDLIERPIGQPTSVKMESLTFKPWEIRTFQASPQPRPVSR